MHVTFTELEVTSPLEEHYMFTLELSRGYELTACLGTTCTRYSGKQRIGDARKAQQKNDGQTARAKALRESCPGALLR